MIFQFNNETILEVKRGVLSFITVQRLKQIKNYSTFSDSEIDLEKKNLIRMIRSFGAYEKNTVFKKGDLGSTYKIISHYQRLSKLQEYLLKNGTDEKIRKVLSRGYRDNQEFLDFKEIKKLSLEEECLRQNLYAKEDYLVIKTDIPASELGLGKKVNVYNFFSNLTEKKYLEIKNNLDLLAQQHKKAYDSLDYDKSMKLKENDLLKLLSKLSLTNQKTDIRDINALDNNIQCSNRGSEVTLKIYENEVDIKPKVIKFGQGYMSMKKYGQKPDYFMIDKEEDFDYSIENGKLNIYKFNKGRKVMVNTYSAFKVEEEYDKPVLNHFTLSEIPVVFSENISNSVSEQLKKMEVEEFVIITEVVKLAKSKLMKELQGRRRAFEALTQLKKISFNNKAFDVNLAIKKANALSSMETLIDDGEDFADVKFGVTIKTDFKDKDLLKQLNQNKADLSFEELPSVIEDFNSPILFEKYIEVQEKVINLSLTEIASMINLRYGETYFSGRTELLDSELSKINNKHAYVLREEQVQSINLFDGPEKFNFLIIAQSGGGKSFMTVNLMDNFLDVNPNNLCWILDRGGSYINFTEIQGGNNIGISAADSKSCINPFLFSNYFAKLIKILKYENLKELTIEQQREMKLISKTKMLDIGDLEDSFEFVDGKIQSTSFEASEPQALLSIYVGFIEEMIKIEQLDSIDRNRLLIENAIVNLISDKYNPKLDSDHNHYILPSEIKEEIIKLVKEKEKNLAADERYQNRIEDLLSRMNKFLDTSAFGNLFNKKPQLDLSKRLINIDFGEIQDEDIQNLALASVISNFFVVMTSARNKKGQKIILIDEAHAVLNAESSIGLKSVSYLFRTTRKHGALAGLISQSIKDFSKEKGEVREDKMTHFNGIVGNAGWVFLLKQHAKEDCINRLEMKPEDAEYVNNNQTFRFFVKTQHSGKAMLLTSDLGYAVATTNKEEKLMLGYLDKFVVDNNLSKRLVLFSELFGKSFISSYQDVSGFCSSELGNNDINSFKEKLRQCFKLYKSDKKMKFDKYIDLVASRFKNELDIRVANSILINILNNGKIQPFFDIIIKELRV